MKSHNPNAVPAPAALHLHLHSLLPPFPFCSNVLPPHLANIAFIGQHATFAHVLTASLESRWLAGALSGQVKLPAKEAQLADIARQQASRCIKLPARVLRLHRAGQASCRLSACTNDHQLSICLLLDQAWWQRASVYQACRAANNFCASF